MIILDRCRWFIDSRQGIRRFSDSKIAERLIRMFSFAGDIVLDPFVGTGSTLAAAVRTSDGNSIGVEIDPVYFKMAKRRLADCCAAKTQMFGPIAAVR